MSHDRSDADLGTRLASVLASTAAETSAPGVQAALVDHGDVTWTGTDGVADSDAGTPVTDTTVFCLASLGKPLVAALALRLVEEGRLDLDAPAATFLGDEVPGTATVTPRMLLTHTSGYPDLYDSPAVAALLRPDEDEPGSGADYDPDRPFTWEMLRPGILEPVGPGTVWEYSNTGYVVLTEILGRVLGGDDGFADAWATLTRRYGRAPDDDALTMHRSRVRLDRMSHGYDVRPDGSLVDASAGHPAIGIPTDLFGLPFGDGLFAGTATGAATFLDALLVRRDGPRPGLGGADDDDHAAGRGVRPPRHVHLRPGHVPDGGPRRGVAGTPGVVRRVHGRRHVRADARADAGRGHQRLGHGAPGHRRLAGARRGVPQSSGRSGLSTNSVKRR